MGTAELKRSVGLQMGHRRGVTCFLYFGWLEEEERKRRIKNDSSFLSPIWVDGGVVS